MAATGARTAGAPGAGSSAPRLAALLFAALAIATVGAFFVTTRLKRSTPVIEQLTFRRSFSPNGDGRFDAALFAFRLRRTDEVTVSVVNRDGDQVRTLAQDVLLRGGRRYRFRWDGRTETGRIAPDDEYHLRVGLRRQGRSVTTTRKLFLDTVPPRPVVKYVSPGSISPDREGAANSAAFRFAGPVRRARLLVYRTDLRRPRLVAAQALRRDEPTGRWNGRVTGNRPAASGAYLLVVRAQDAAGNVGPPRVPPRRAAVRGHPGVSVRYVDAYATRPVAQAGTRLQVTVKADGRRYRWSLRRLGAQRALRRGTQRSGSLSVPVPRFARSGIAMLTLRVGSHRHTRPVPVQGRRRARVLVVLPDATWQARNRFEANGDGYPDLLPEDPRVTLLRPYQGGLPPGFAGDQSGVMGFLDREGLRYDLTTDLALALPRGPRLGRYSGVLYAGAPRFSPLSVQGKLRGYLAGGGRLAWIGRGGFDWNVRVAGRAPSGLGAGTLLRSRRPTTRALLGERLRYEPEAVPVAVLSDRIGFFQGVPGSFGPFGPLEESLRLPAGARMLASAGTGERRRALVVYRKDGGVVARVGVDGFGRALRTSPAAARIMRRLWVLLSR